MRNQPSSETSKQRFRGPLLLTCLGIFLGVVSAVVGQQFDDAELYAASSATDFASSALDTGSDARWWTAVDTFLTVPSFSLAFVGLLSLLRRVRNPPKGFDIATRVGFGTTAIAALANLILNAAIFLGLGRVDLDDAAKVLQPATAIINTIRVGTIANGVTFLATMVIILGLGVTLLVRRLSSRFRSGKPAMSDRPAADRREDRVLG